MTPLYWFLASKCFLWVRQSAVAVEAASVMLKGRVPTWSSDSRLRSKLLNITVASAILDVTIFHWRGAGASVFAGKLT